MDAYLVKDIQHARLDEKTRNILTFAYHSADKARVEDESFKRAFRHLLTNEELTETALVVNMCKGLQDFIHVLDLPH